MTKGISIRVQINQKRLSKNVTMLSIRSFSQKGSYIPSAPMNGFFGTV